MMPVIRISDATITKLMQLAVPLVDNYDTVIARLADAALGKLVYTMPHVSMASAPPAPQGATPVWDVEPHDDLTHTRLISAEFDNVSIQKASWNNLAKYALETAYRKLGSLDAL